MAVNNITEIQHILYINLDHRTDRREQVVNELAEVGFLNKSIERFSAIKMSAPAIGCSISHLKCLEKAKRLGWDHVLIVEDDIHFTDPALFKTQFNKLLSSNLNYDVIMLGGNNAGSYQIIGDYAVKITRCLTTTGYLVKSNYYDTLIHNYRNGIQFFLQFTNLPQKYAIDTYWNLLQQKDNWYVVYPLCVSQHASFSDIENRIVNYDKYMLILDKSHLFKK
jgi:GR25 family glycosyltransferase involved in LPS biosynthesis